MLKDHAPWKAAANHLMFCCFSAGLCGFLSVPFSSSNREELSGFVCVLYSQRLLWSHAWLFLVSCYMIINLRFKFQNSAVNRVSTTIRVNLMRTCNSRELRPHKNCGCGRSFCVFDFDVFLCVSTNLEGTSMHMILLTAHEGNTINKWEWHFRIIGEWKKNENENFTWSENDMKQEKKWKTKWKKNEKIIPWSGLSLWL